VTRLPGALSLLLTASAWGADYYVDVESRGGQCDDAGPGSLERPWRTLARAASGQEPRPQAGDTIWVRGGVYQETVTIEAEGALERPLTIRAFPRERPIIDGEGERANGIILADTGSADHVVIEGLTLRNFASDGAGIQASQRTGIVMRLLEVSGARIGVWLLGCTDCKLLESNIHDCETNNVLVDTRCADIVLADNHVHHCRGSHCISIYAPGDGVRGRGLLVSVEPHAPGLARFTMQELQLNEVRHGTLKGQDEAGTVDRPSLVLFFAEEDPGTEAKPIAGGTYRLQDGRDWFVLRKNADWGDKPYSPDGKTGLFELAEGGLAALAGAKYAYIAYIFSPEVANRDIQVLRNEVDHARTQGIWVQRGDGVLIERNRSHHNGASGIQIEALCRRIWLEGNVCYANSTYHNHETGIWLDETIDAVVHKNICHSNQKGMGVTQCQWVLARNNVIYSNQAQHVSRNTEGCHRNAGAFWYSGGRHYHLGAPPGAEHNAFVHNTCYGNGTETSTWGGIQHGIAGYPMVGQNRIVNNLVQNSLGAHAIYAWSPRGRLRPPGILDGNIYHAAGGVRALWRAEAEPATYVISDPQGLADYRAASGQEAHSLVREVAFVKADAADFRLAEGSIAVDGGQPLTRTTAGGTGAEVPVADVSCFSAGLKTRDGTVLKPGDEIMIAGSRARIVDVDRNACVLTIDGALTWRENDPVSYVYAGAGPDVGAFETGLPVTQSDTLSGPAAGQLLGADLRPEGRHSCCVAGAGERGHGQAGDPTVL